MLSFLQKSWFLAALFTLISIGLWIGVWWPEKVASIPEPVADATKWLTPLVLFMMSVTLDSRRMWAAIRSPSPVLWASIVNFGLLPLLALPLLRIQLHPDYVVGLMVAASVPCTMAAASVWTRKAEGNDAVSMLVTILTNGLCFLVTPVWLKLGIGQQVPIDTWEMVLKLLQSALLPILIGQLVRLVGPLRSMADQRKTSLGVAAQLTILLIVFWSALHQGPPETSPQGATKGAILPATLVVGMCVVALHLSGLCVAYYAGRTLGFARADVIAVTFAGSQKTLPIGVHIATLFLATAPLAVYPILMFHALQLLIDTLLVERLKQWKASAP